MWHIAMMRSVSGVGFLCHVRDGTRLVRAVNGCARRYPGRMDPLAPFSPETRAWFERAFDGADARAGSSAGRRSRPASTC